MTSTTHTIITTPVGDLTVVDIDGSLSGIYFHGHWTKPDRAQFGARDDRGFDAITTQLDEYFAGDRTRFDLPTLAAGDDFRQRVWARLREIPYGATTTYGAIAIELGGTAALARAVGRAVGSNPVSIVIPCHRVVGKDGTLTGYAGGLERKRHLLELEGAEIVAPALF